MNENRESEPSWFIILCLVAFAALAALSLAWEWIRSRWRKVKL